MPNSVYTYISRVYCWVGFNGISTIVDYLMSNLIYTYTLNMICKYFVDNILKQTWAHFFCTQMVSSISIKHE